MAKLEKCKTCKKEVSSSAKSCPHCGQKNPTTTWKDITIGFAVLGAIGYGLFVWLSTDDGRDILTETTAPLVKADEVSSDNVVAQKEPLDGIAYSYEIIEEDDYGFAGRNRLRWDITSQNKMTTNDMAVTAIQAAKDLMKRYRSTHQADVWFYQSAELGGLFWGANATFTPDGKGNGGTSFDGKIWEIRVISEPLTQHEVKVISSWRKYRHMFESDDGLNEDALKAYLSDQLDLDKDQINLPWVNHGDFEYDPIQNTYQIAD